MCRFNLRKVYLGAGFFAAEHFEAENYTILISLQTAIFHHFLAKSAWQRRKLILKIIDMGHKVVCNINIQKNCCQYNKFCVNSNMFGVSIFSHAFLPICHLWIRVKYGAPLKVNIFLFYH